MQARANFMSAARVGNVRGMASAVRQGVHVNIDKARQIYRGSQPVVKATPYRRPPERTT